MAAAAGIYFRPCSDTSPTATNPGSRGEPHSRHCCGTPVHACGTKNCAAGHIGRFRFECMICMHVCRARGRSGRHAADRVYGGRHAAGADATGRAPHARGWPGAGGGQARGWRGMRCTTGVAAVHRMPGHAPHARCMQWDSVLLRTAPLRRRRAPAVSGHGSNHDVGSQLGCCLRRSPASVAARGCCSTSGRDLHVFDNLGVGASGRMSSVPLFGTLGSEPDIYVLDWWVLLCGCVV